MNLKETEKKKCSRLTFRRKGFHKNTILLGLVLDDDDQFVKFQAGNKKHTIRKELVQSIEGTDVDFVGQGVDTK